MDGLHSYVHVQSLELNVLATVAPALEAIADDLKIRSQTLLIKSLSVYVLGDAIVPLVSSSLSEVYGRVIILSAANIFYIIFNTLCGIAKTQNQLIAYRFLAGLGGAGPFGVCISMCFLSLVLI
jgi:MFS family permease